MASRVLCDLKIPPKLKGKFYRVAIRSALLYGSECWPIKKEHERKLEVTEMRMLRWMCGRTLLDRIPTGVFRKELRVAPISDNIREGRLRWFGHVKRRHRSAPVRRVESVTIEGVRGRGKPKKTWDEQLRVDMAALDLSKDITYDRRAWRCRIWVVDYP